jgi:hypothetical protein
MGWWEDPAARGSAGEDPATAGEALRAAVEAITREEFAAARCWLVAAVQAAPQDPRGRALLSGVELALGNPGGAAAAVERALQLDPGGPLPLLKAGEYRLRVGDLEGAAAAFLAALRAAPAGDGIARAAARSLVVVRLRRRQAITRRASLPGLPAGLGKAVLASLARRVFRRLGSAAPLVLARLHRPSRPVAPFPTTLRGSAGAPPSSSRSQEVPS